MHRERATAIGFGAILLWALLALLTDLAAGVPPFQMAAMTFAIGGLTGLALTSRRGGARRAFLQPAAAWMVGVGGLFGYHFLYFTALGLAPAAEASLIAFLWPLLIVLGSTLVTGDGIKPRHLIGAFMGLSGATMLVAGRLDTSADAMQLTGYAIALAAAFVWASYSILSRRVATVPTDAVTAYCLVTAALAMLCHTAFEVTVIPASALAWIGIIGLGLGPVGAAFFLWDIGMKHGDMSLLGALAYAAPLLSTLVLLAFGRAEASMTLLAGCLLITAGAIVATGAVLSMRPGRR